jgi:hypothetical protein
MAFSVFTVKYDVDSMAIQLKKKIFQIQKNILSSFVITIASPGYSVRRAELLKNSAATSLAWIEV